jgi:hypothetical protein
MRSKAENTMKRSHVALGAIALSGLAASALLMTDVASKDGFFSHALAASQLSDTELQGKLQEQGYANIQIVRHEGSHVEVTATKNGQVVKLAVNGTTGPTAVTQARIDFSDG